MQKNDSIASKDLVFGSGGQICERTYLRCRYVCSPALGM